MMMLTLVVVLQVVTLVLAAVSLVGWEAVDAMDEWIQEHTGSAAIVALVLVNVLLLVVL